MTLVTDTVGYKKILDLMGLALRVTLCRKSSLGFFLRHFQSVISVKSVEEPTPFVLLQQTQTRDRYYPDHLEIIQLK